MTDAPNPKTLDLIGVLSGRDYPTLDIEVYFNETLGFEIGQLQDEISSSEARGDEAALAELDKKKADLLSQYENEKYVVTLQAIPEKVRRRIMEKIQEDFPEETDLLGRPKPNPGADTAFAEEMWKSYLRTVTSPDGTSKVVDEADITALLNDAPALAQEAITRGIADLQTRSARGFEFAAKEVDFLSQASPEG